MLANLPFLVVAVMIGLGLYTMLFNRNLIKIVIGLTIIENAVNLFLIALAYKNGAVAPIYTSAPSTSMVMPTPHALTLTAIVIAMATTAMMLSLIMQIYKHYHTLDAFKIRRLRE